MVSRNEIKLIKSLNSKKNRLKELLFTVEGEKMVDELLSSNYKVKKIYGTKVWYENNFSKLDLIDFQKISIGFRSTSILGSLCRQKYGPWLL